MSCNNLAIIAAAGSGKTTQIVEDVLSIIDEKVLLITYTIENTSLLKKKIVERNGLIPENVEVMSWFGFLLQHCIRPYRSSVWDTRISRIDFDSKANMYIPEINTRSHYFSSKDAILKDRASKFAIKCNTATNGAVIQRLEKLYSRIYIDEIQDVAGEDIDLVKLLMESAIVVTVVGDIRQALYYTCSARKNINNRGSKLLSLFRQWERSGLLEIKFKDYSYRCVQSICDLSDSIFPEIDEKTQSKNTMLRKHTGIYIVRTADFEKYVTAYNPVVLRWKINSKIPKCETPYKVQNIGISKGATYEDVIIICTDNMSKFVKNSTIPDSEKAKCALYVAITRAKFSVAFVCDDLKYNADIFKLYDPQKENHPK